MLTELRAIPVTIAAAASLSGAADLGGAPLVAIEMPAAWTTASLTFQASRDGVTFYDLYDAVSEVIVSAAAASRYIMLLPADWYGIRHLKVRSGTSGTPVNQAAARTLQLVTREA